MRPIRYHPGEQKPDPNGHGESGTLKGFASLRILVATDCVSVAGDTGFNGETTNRPTPQISTQINRRYITLPHKALGEPKPRLSGSVSALASEQTQPTLDGTGFVAH